MSRGHNRERAVKALLEGDDWFVVRATGSLGNADLVALKDGHMPRLVEVKSDAIHPYAHFGPARRRELLLAARIAGAQAWLCWWPPHGVPTWIAAEAWPNTNPLVEREAA